MSPTSNAAPADCDRRGPEFQQHTVGTVGRQDSPGSGLARLEGADLIEAYGPGWTSWLVPLCALTPHTHPERDESGDWIERPCADPGKRPIGAKWTTRAVERAAQTAGDPEALTEHADALAAHIRLRGANVGLVVPTGALVLDVDDAESMRIAEMVTDLADAPRQLSSRGAHYVVKAPAEAARWAQQTKVTLSNGMAFDFRLAEKGQIVVAPSIHNSGAVYHWDRELPASPSELPDLSADLIMMIDEALKTKQINEKDRARFEWPTDGSKWTAGDRHGNLRSAAWRLAGAGAGTDEIAAILFALNARYCDPPKGAEEVWRLAESAARKTEENAAGGYWGEWGSSSGGEEPSTPVFEPLAALEPDPLPAFPVEALPDPIRAYVVDVAEAMQTPIELAVGPVLAAISGSVGRKIVMDWGAHVEALSLYLAAIAAPGTRKSSVFQEGFDPIERAERTLHEQGAAARAEAATTAAVLERRVRKLSDKAAKCEDRAERAELIAEATTAQEECDEAARESHPPRLIAADATPERLAVMLKENGERLILASPEGAEIFDRLGRYAKGNEPNLELLLKAWCGEAARVDRVTADPVHLRRPSLTIAAALQPDVMRTLGSQQAMSGRGLLARFLWIVPSDNRGYRDPADARRVDERLRYQYRTVLDQLLAIPNEDEPYRLRLEGAALDRFHDAARHFEHSMREGEQLEDLREWASKAAGLVARLSGLVALARDPHPSVAITANDVAAGDAIARWASAHAIRALGMLDGETGDRRVDRLWKWIRRRSDPLADFTRSEIWIGCKGGVFKIAANLDAPLARLIAAGRIARRLVPSDQAGRPANVFAINPEAIPDEN